MTLTTSTGIVYTDKLLYHHGDMPANAAESGQQYGGNYPCGNCGIHASMFDDMAYLAKRDLNSLGKKEELFKRLQRELGGIQRVPTLLSSTEATTRI